MEKAICTSDNNRNYRAQEFAELPEQLRTAYRKHLLCPECRQRAYFRKAHSGFDALFGASPHMPQCGERRTDPSKVKTITKTLEAYLARRTRKVDLNLDDSIALSEIDADQTRQEKQSANKKQDRPLSGGRTQFESNWSLYNLLAALVRDPALALSKHVITAKDLIEPQPFFRFFVNTMSLPRHHRSNETKGYWGTVANANYAQNGDLWVNSGDLSGGSKKLDICIHSDAVTGFLTRFLIRNPKDLLGASILVIGDAEDSFMNYKVQVRKPGHIAILMASDLK
ncbi:hypothetical protein ABT364_22930 [Massilia sp. SR12]